MWCSISHDYYPTGEVSSFNLRSKVQVELNHQQLPVNAMWSKSVVILLFAVCFSAFFVENNGLEVKEFVNKYVVRPMKSLLPHKETSEASDEKDKESGNFDFIGRDIIRETSKVAKTIGKNIKEFVSKNTKGLDCDKEFSGEMVDGFKSKVKAIYPGTKWCGDGNISKSYDDLGKFADTDKCCREHDMCPINIDAGATKYDLVNTGLFTRSHCDCDKKFYDCLKEAGGVVAESIGFTYFTVLGPQCFKEEYPIIGCLDTKEKKCLQYVTDTRRPKMYQWFDSPTF
nr:PREDICTED: phospholipase A2C isoform X1 [Tribolium castaneum]|eukprot:XP_008193524.2 PREDICTED: phospholipase A2C isoform X1 [Tribolium castaneum]